jgi:putative oxidoreductase
MKRSHDMDVALRVGRIIVGGYFMDDVVSQFIGFGMMTQDAKMKGVPFPAIAQGLTGIIRLLGGRGVVFGIQPLAGIALRVPFPVPVSLMMHDFWKLEDPPLKMADKINCTKNMALVGAVIMLLAIPVPWPLSLVM